MELLCQIRTKHTKTAQQAPNISKMIQHEQLIESHPLSATSCRLKLQNYFRARLCDKKQLQYIFIFQPGTQRHTYKYI